MKIAIIPARGGSQGLPGKNTRQLCGQPLIAYTISAALRSQLLAAVFVSTDDDAIADIATRVGAQVIRHPPELSANDRPTAPVIAWAVEFLEHAGTRCDVVAVMRATTPLRSTEDVDAALQLLEAHRDADSVVSVTPSVVHPTRVKRIDENGFLKDAFEHEGQMPHRRQTFGKMFVRNGGIYASRRAVISPASLWGKRCLAYVMPEERSVNINTPFDFLIAELLLMSDDPNKTVRHDNAGIVR